MVGSIPTGSTILLAKYKLLFGRELDSRLCCIGFKMGAHSYLVTFEVSNRVEVSKRWGSIVEDDAYESGRGPYAGNATTLGTQIRFRDERLSSHREAEEYVLDNHNKWDSPLACSYYLPVKPTERDKRRVESAKAKLQSVKEKKYDAMASMYDAFFGRKSEFIGCKECGSRLSVARLKEKFSSRGKRSSWINYPSIPACPLCSASLLSETNRNRIIRLTEKVEIAERKLREASRPKAGKKLAWVVGGWAAC